MRQGSLGFLTPYLPQDHFPSSISVQSSLWPDTSDFTVRTMSSLAASTPLPPLSLQSIATSDALDPVAPLAPCPAPMSSPEETVAAPDADQQTPSSSEDSVLLATQPAASSSAQPAARQQPERAAKRRRVEQENEAVVEPTEPTVQVSKGKSNATPTELLATNIVASSDSEGHATDDAKTSNRPQVNTLATIISPTLRRSKRLRVGAASASSQRPRPSAATFSDPTSSASDVPETAGPSSAAAEPVLPLGRICKLLKKDGTRCYHRLTSSKSVNQKHANTHPRVSKNEPGFRCTFLGCRSTVQYGTKHSRNKHILEHHWGHRFPCDVPGCDKVFGREDEVPRHKRTAHRR